MELPTVGEITDLAQWNALVGFLFPLLAAFLKQSTLSKSVNTAISIAAAVIAAGITTAAAGDLNWENWAISFITLYTVAGTMYANLWKPIGVEEPLQVKTTVVRRNEMTTVA
jgi:hypothetical protein